MGKMVTLRYIDMCPCLHEDLTEILNDDMAEKLKCKTHTENSLWEAQALSFPRTMADNKISG